MNEGLVRTERGYSGSVFKYPLEPDRRDEISERSVGADRNPALHKLRPPDGKHIDNTIDRPRFLTSDSRKHRPILER